MSVISGALLIGGEEVLGIQGDLRAVDPTTGNILDPAFGGASSNDLERACACAAQAFPHYRRTDDESRARFLEAIASEILELGEALIERAVAETGLPASRIIGERGRTTGQLRMFAQLVRNGSWRGVRVDPALPDREPAPRPDLRLRKIPLGPVAIFGASNFPLAFSVAGGDTASALAAGCPVIVKAHPAHPGTSELVGRAIQLAAKNCMIHPGVFALLHDSGLSIAQALVADHRIKAVSFTGSRKGGLALVDIARARPEPIPVFAEMSSVNPAVILPHALAARGASIGRDLVAAMTMGAGQFCTSPGLVFAVDGPDLARFVAAAAEAVSTASAATMLSRAIKDAFEASVDRLVSHGASVVARGGAAPGNRAAPVLLETTAHELLTCRALSDEAFGAACVVVRCVDLQQLAEAVESLEGQLTIAIHLDPADQALARELLPIVELKAGRVIANGFGTGVEVADAMVHAGPYPATSDGGRTTSVGSLAIERFLRPVCYQNLPGDLLPLELR